MALVTTPGAANADSYADLTELTAYLASRMPVSTLATATGPQQEAAMRMAARLIDASFDWTGASVDAVQALAFPRTGMFSRNGFAIATSGAASIAQPLKDAQCEYAAQLYAGDLLSDNAAAKLGITSVKAGSVAVAFKDINESTTESVDILIRRLGFDLRWAGRMVPDIVRALLVHTWFREHSIKRSVMFGAV